MKKDVDTLTLLNECTETNPEEIQLTRDGRSRKAKELGVCDECGGQIIKRITSLSCCGYNFSLPACEDCEAEYWEEQWAFAVGIEEFENAIWRRIDR